MKLHNIQEIAVAHFAAHPHIGVDDIGILVFLAIATVIALIGILTSLVGTRF